MLRITEQKGRKSSLINVALYWPLNLKLPPLLSNASLGEIPKKEKKGDLKFVHFKRYVS